MATALSRPSFDNKTDRSRELHGMVTELWNNRRIRYRVVAELFLQIPFAFGLMAGCYLALMLGWLRGIWVIPLLAGIAVGGVAMGGLFHDSNHRAVFSPLGRSRRWDYILAWIVSDMMLGMSGYHWSRKHDFHHTDTNILGLDGDLQTEPILRLHPKSPMVRMCRYQHIYAWALYPFILIPLHIRGHRIALFGGKHGSHVLPRAKGWELAGTIAGLPIFYAWALVAPVWLYGWSALWSVLAVFLAVGFVYALAFQLAHNLPDLEYPTVEELIAEAQEGNRKEGYVHQLETTSNFCPDNWLLRWMLGGLTHQVEHHLSRRYPHPFYRFMAKVVEKWCKKHGLPYHVQPTLWAAIKAHGTQLREMGRQGHPMEIEMG